MTYKFKLISGNVVFFYVTPRNVVNGSQRLEGTCSVHLRDRILNATKISVHMQSVNNATMNICVVALQQKTFFRMSPDQKLSYSRCGGFITGVFWIRCFRGSGQNGEAQIIPEPCRNSNPVLQATASRCTDCRPLLQLEVQLFK